MRVLRDRLLIHRCQPRPGALRGANPAVASQERDDCRAAAWLESDNTFVINLGEVLQSMTGNYLVATPVHGRREADRIIARSGTDRVLASAGSSDRGFFRSDDLLVNSACGHVQDSRTNVFYLPVIGACDGGVCLTLDDAE